MAPLPALTVPPVLRERCLHSRARPEPPDFQRAPLRSAQRPTRNPGRSASFANRSVSAPGGGRTCHCGASGARGAAGSGSFRGTLRPVSRSGVALCFLPRQQSGRRGGSVGAGLPPGMGGHRPLPLAGQAVPGLVVRARPQRGDRLASARETGAILERRRVPTRPGKSERGARHDSVAGRRVAGRGDGSAHA